MESTILHHLFLFQGFGMLLPWNTIITAHDFFRLMFDHPTFQSYFAFYFNTSLVAITLFWLKRPVLYGSISYLLISVSFLIFLLMRVINQSHNFYFYICCLLIAIDGAATATIQSRIMALATLRGDKAIQSVLIGQALAGLTISASDFLFKVVSLAGNKFIDPFIVYFSFAFIMSILCLLTFNRLSNTTMLSIYQHIDDNQPEPEIDYPDGSIEDEIADEIETQPEYELSLAKYHILTCFFTLFITLFLFPAVTSLIEPVEDVDNQYYIALFVPLGFFLYNLGDTLGRFVSILPNIHVLLAFSISRLSFVYIFPYLYLNSPNYRDLYFFASLFVFGITNGYITNGAMMLASRKFRNEHVGKVMNFSMLCGCVVGSCGSVVLANWLVT
eukprot:NODE_140_length_17926_cov_0.139620.p4 type:complete len:387 gc:universal NODE_140_length_17926_cov_0.139620:7026-8186(+)